MNTGFLFIKKDLLPRNYQIIHLFPTSDHYFTNDTTDNTNSTGLRTSKVRNINGTNS